MIANGPPNTGLMYGDVTVQLRSEPARQVPMVQKPSGPAADLPQDKVTLSEAGRRYSAGLTRERGESGESEHTAAAPKGSAATAAALDELTAEEQQAVFKLKQRDREVRAHEQAHLANAGQYASGGPTYSFQTGPDGKRYAVGGEVPIDVSKERTPEQTILKMRAVQRAALAPASPSSADRSIAAAAAMKEAEALREVNNSASGGPEGIKPDDDSSPDKETLEPSPANGAEHPVRRQDFQAIYA